MKSISIKIVAMVAIIAMVFIAPNLRTQASRLTKVGYLDINSVVTTMLADSSVMVKLDGVIDAETTDRDAIIRREIDKHIAGAIPTIVRREGYTLILERSDFKIVYADRNFDITPQVIAFVRESIKK